MSGEKIRAYILVNTRVGEEHKIAGMIESLGEGVTEVVVTYGQFDIVVRLELENFRQLDKIVTRIREIDGVTATITLIGS